MYNSVQKSLEKLGVYILYLVAFLLPLSVFVVFPNPFLTGKIALLIFGVSLAIILKAINTLLKGSFVFSTGKFDLAVFLIALSYLLAAIFKTPNKMEAFFAPGTATIIIASSLFYFLVLNLKKRKKKTFGLALFFSGVAFSLISLSAYFGILAKIPQLPPFIKNTSFNTFGGILPAIVFLATLIPLGIGLIVSQKQTVEKLFFAAASVILALGLGISIYTALPGKPTSTPFVRFDTSWSVATDTLRTSPILGIGPGNYLTAFNRFRPLSYNQTDLWNVRFTSSKSFYLTILTETGLLGALSFLILLASVYRVFIKKLDKIRNAVAISLLILLVLLALFPATPTLIFLLFSLLALNTPTKRVHINLSAQVSSASNLAKRLPAIIVAVPVIIAVILFGFYAKNTLAAEVKFKMALNALAVNDGKQTYDLMREAIGLNPLVDRYHGAYSQVNLALASNLASKATVPGEELTDEDRNTISQLIQQAIRESKANVSLNPQRSGAWLALAQTYQVIIAFAEGADAFAVQSYVQAVSLDPTNPNLRISLGGIYYSLGRYDEAIETFKLAVLAKGDLANAHYNLAVAYREKGEVEKAISQMQAVLSLVETGTPDYDLATAELESLEKRKDAEKTENTQNLTTPTEIEKVIQPPLELPEDSSPPQQ